jgi:hypothetical protein
MIIFDQEIEILYDVGGGVGVWWSWHNLQVFWSSTSLQSEKSDNSDSLHTKKASSRFVPLFKAHISSPGVLTRWKLPELREWRNLMFRSWEHS